MAIKYYPFDEFILDDEKGDTIIKGIIYDDGRLIFRDGEEITITTIYSFIDNFCESGYKLQIYIYHEYREFKEHYEDTNFYEREIKLYMKRTE